MKVKLYHRHYGVHTLEKEIDIKGKFKDYYIPDNNCKKYEQPDDKINEDLLLENIPEKFLSVKPNKILLTREDKNKDGSLGIKDTKYFRSYSKYYDCFVLEICREY